MGFLSFFKKKPKQKRFSLTTETVDKGFDKSIEIVDKIITDGKLNHATLNALSLLYFSKEIPSGVYKIKDCKHYGLVFGIKSIYCIKSDDGTTLEDIQLYLEDIGTDSSMCITVSVKDFMDMFELIPAPSLKDDKEVA